MESSTITIKKILLDIGLTSADVARELNVSLPEVSYVIQFRRKTGNRVESIRKGIYMILGRELLKIGGAVPSYNELWKINGIQKAS